MDELKIAVPRPKAPKPRPAPRTCPPPTPAAALKPGPKDAPPAPPYFTETTDGTADVADMADMDDVTGTMEPASDDFGLDEAGDVFLAEAAPDLENDPETTAEPDEPTELLFPAEEPALGGSPAEAGSTVVPLAVELDQAAVRTIPASIYQDQVPEPGAVRLVGTADDAVDDAPDAVLQWDEPLRLDAAPDQAEEPLPETEDLSEPDDASETTDAAEVGEPKSAEPAEETGPAAPAAASPPRRAAARKRRRGRIRAALDASAALRWSLVGALVALLVAGLGLGWSYFSRPVTPAAKVARIRVANLPRVAPLEPGFYEFYARQREAANKTEATIAQGSGLSQALEAVGLGAPQRSAAIIECLTKAGGINPNAVRAGVNIKAFWADRGRSELRRLEYHPESGAAPLVVMPRADGGFWLYNTASPALTLSAAREGVVESSLWQAASDAGLDASVILSLSDILASDVDFFNDIKTGDSFQVLYSREYRDGRPQGAPIIDMVKLVNKGQPYEYYRFVGQGDKVGYYDPEGRTSHKAFFVTPLQYKRISSGFTMKRMHPIHRVVRAHQGVDYAAPSGTPISSVADGTVVFADWNGGYGRLITIKHDETYTTMYAHMSRFAPGIKKGVKVKQGDLIGYVGATGTATGPHLDFRLKKNGVFINPVPELAKQQGRKLESGDYIDLTKVIGLTRERMKDQLAAASQSGV